MKKLEEKFDAICDKIHYEVELAEHYRGIRGNFNRGFDREERQAYKNEWKHAIRAALHIPGLFVLAAILIISVH